MIMSNLINEAERLIEADTPESTPARLNPDLPPMEPPLHGHGWPPETVPYPISRAMEFCLENCQLAQCSKEPTGSEDLFPQRCRFPLHCSIVPSAGKL